MLIEFTVGNYRSFKEPQTLSMIVASIKSQDKAVDENNVFHVEGQPALLTSAAIYGANASGKSNLIHALDFMCQFVRTSSRRTEPTGGIEVEPFRLSVDTIRQPSFFEMVFNTDGRRYRYGFELTTERVEKEWLFHVPTIREAKLFERTRDEVDIGRTYSEGKKELFERTRPNALFLSVIAEFNGPIATQLIKWFISFTILAPESTGTFLRRKWLLRSPRPQGYLEHPVYAQDVSNLIQRLDLNIRDIYLEERILQLPLFPVDEPTELDELDKPSSKSREYRERRISTVRTVHTLYDDDGQPVGEELFLLDEHESEGTRRLFALAGPLLESLRRGRVLVVDEFDARLHPLMTRELVKLFNNRETNPNGAQLVFTTQDTNLLDNTLFRRDQIWFVEKNRQGASNVYSLAEFKGVRNDLSLERNYIQGRFGAIPYINLNKLLDLVAEEHDEEG